MQRARWKGYLPAYYPTSKKVIVEVTLGAVRNVAELLRADIVGHWVKFSRPGERNNSAVFCELLLDLHKCLNVVPYDPTPALYRMWELPEGDQVEEGGAS